MKRGYAWAAAAIALAVALGYWLGGGSVAGGVAKSDTAAERKPLYYRNPMGLPDTSPVPKKDPMGMDYVPVYAGEENAAAKDAVAPGVVSISPEKIQKLGVRTEAASLRTLDRVVRAAGRIEPDERRLYVIAPKFEGYVERLHVNITGQPVVRGQALFEAYSPELVSAQSEYAIAMQGAAAMQSAGSEAQGGMRQLAEASLARLKSWDISPAQIKSLEKSGAARRTLVFSSPVNGIVTEKKAVQGMRFMPGDALFQIADLSAVWVVADVFEQDIAQVKLGAKATVKLDAYPDKVFTGRIAYVYPRLTPETRTVPVRIELANPQGLLKPAMFAQVELPAATRGQVLAVPKSAVLDSGVRQLVLVQRGEGRFEPRTVKLGERGGEYVEIREGLQEGERVVTSANFLIDAESNLKAATGSFVPGGDSGEPTSADPKQVGHMGAGTLDTVDAKAGTLSITHGPIASLNWPAMTMEFSLANPALLGKLKPGDKVSFEFVERKPGEWVITKLTPKPDIQAGH